MQTLSFDKLFCSAEKNTSSTRVENGSSYSRAISPVARISATSCAHKLELASPDVPRSTVRCREARRPVRASESDCNRTLADLSLQGLQAAAIFPALAARSWFQSCGLVGVRPPHIQLATLLQDDLPRTKSGLGRIDPKRSATFQQSSSDSSGP